jgi:hypothetical protein
LWNEKFKKDFLPHKGGRIEVGGGFKVITPPPTPSPVKGEGVGLFSWFKGDVFLIISLVRVSIFIPLRKF